MITGLGSDIIEVSRVRKSIETISGFREKIFSGTEISYCEKKKNKFESYAARFAAKEAFFKALGTGWRNGMAFCEVEIINDELGKPVMILTGRSLEEKEKYGITAVHVSLSHTKESAVAVVILEKKE